MYRQDQRVLITGCGGMLGNAVYPFFDYWYDEVLATDKDVNEPWLTYLDIRDHMALERIFDEFRPDVVLHLAAETDLEYCQTHAATARDVNDVASRQIAEISARHGATLVYISTAGVFDGKKSGGYTEKDQPRPIMVYGETKYAGELHTRGKCPRSFVIRAGWMMGGGREKEKKFIFKILKQIGAGKREIFAVTDKLGTPTYTYDFAMNLFLLMNTDKYGTYHMVCEGSGSRYDVAKEILSICGKRDVKLTKVTSEFFAEEYFVTRPYSEILINRNLARQGLNHMRPWREALKEYIETLFPDYIDGAASQARDEPSSCRAYGGEKRRSPRSRLFSTIEYALEKPEGAYNGRRFRKGVTINVSGGGLCLYTFQPIEKGQTVLMGKSRGSLEGKVARVCWAAREKSGLYRAGLTFKG